MPKVIIVGAGLSGLMTAYKLRHSNFELEILEARDRIGGRIYTKKKNSVSLELGATWFGPQHTKLLNLVNELNVPYKIQENGREALYDFRPNGHLERFKLPNQQAPTFKFKHGTVSLLKALEENLNTSVQLNQVIKSVQLGNRIKVQTQSGKIIEGDFLILSIPPQLVFDSIQFEPELPLDLRELVKNTHTWMSDSIKFSCAFDHDFWKNERYQGTLMSPQQIIQEMYDHSDGDTHQKGLVGFLNSKFSNLTQEERRAKVSEYLKTLFGSQASAFSYADVDWRQENYTIDQQAKSLVPHQNNGHAKLRAPLFEGRLFFSASETAAQTPGYMDGAVHRGAEVADQLLDFLS
ncbi:flavin monoamine oxidase family protein [Psychroflexus tropicus]|uniref:flavin monoamine oxidase family protein n=1 Tax=Psychroflexus tropicus TaxID=197345 RepID=UPI000364A18E|nr:FAD-dependent oxidoreductase [Psychroflexus tropicus]